MEKLIISESEKNDISMKNLEIRYEN